MDAAVVEAGPVGVRLKRLRVRPKLDEAVDLHDRATAIAEAVRPGGERLDAVEVDAVLGGGVLRTTPRDMKDGRYFEVGIRPTGEAEVRRLAHGDPADPVEGLADLRIPGQHRR